MGEKDYFQNALSNFTHEVASGGAIRHLAGLGYTVKQISERLDFPTPYGRIQREVWKYFLDTGVILYDEPGMGNPREKVSYVQEYGQFGKVSFRRVVEADSGGTARVIHWRELYTEAGDNEKTVALLRDKLSQSPADTAYMSCKFGLIAYRSPETYAEILKCLDNRQREYIEGLPWEKRVVYHRLDTGMQEILVRLCTAGLYYGECYFIDLEDKVIIQPFDT